MPIRPTLINELSAPNVLVFSSNETMNDVVTQLRSRGLAEASTYVVIVSPSGAYQVGMISDLARIVTLLGPDSFAVPLAELPVPSAGEVISENTPEAGGRIRDRVKANSDKTFVIVNEQGFVALFVNPVRSGMDLTSSSLLRLHGELMPISPDVVVPSSIKPPKCPHCHYQDWYWFKQGHYTCQNCKEIVEAP
jgi:hypothetical protein